MSSTLVITAADPSGRWYLLPGSRNSYDLTVANDSDHAVLCKLTLDEPGEAGAVSPTSLTLNGGESRTVSVAFKSEWLTLRDRKAVVTARDAAGTVLATFVHDLITATATDCSVSLAWKDEISGDGGLRGFILTCVVRSISSTPGVFEPEFTQHPSLRFPEMKRITLGPGESTAFDVPVIWNRSSRDREGWNHPRSIDVAIPVTHGRRATSAPWDLVQQHVEPYLNDTDRSPLITRRPPPQFTQPGGVPAVSPVIPATIPEPTPAPAMTGSLTDRIAQAEMEAGIAVVGPRSQAPAIHPHEDPSKRETIAVAPSTLMVIALALTAIAIGLGWIMHASSGSSAVSTAPVPIASPAAAGGSALAHKIAALKKKNAKGAPRPRASAPAVATQAGAAADVPSAAAPGTATTQSASGSRPTAVSDISRTSQAPARARMSPVDRSALVQLADVGAGYLRGGRQVHVFWDSYAQTRAQVQVLDQNDTMVAQTVVGRRMAVVLPLPRGYRGGVFIQVTAIGYDGERVVSTTSLGPP